ncbi:MAG: transglutaminase-like domain-containing protein [Winogradskyella arenosi]
MKLKKKAIWLIKRHPLLYSVRFKLLSRNATEADLDDDYYQVQNDVKDIPERFHETNRQIFPSGRPESDLECCKQISIWVCKHLMKGPGLSKSSSEALNIMLQGKGGICSDMAQVFNNYCLLNGVKVREWGVIRIPLDDTYGGHAYNEVFCTTLNKWILFDPFWCVYFSNTDGTPLSVVEFYKTVRKGENIERHNFYHIAYLPKDDYEKNYFHPHNVPFLVCNYSNTVYDFALNRFHAYLPIFVIHFMIFILGKSYHYKFPLDNFRMLFENKAKTIKAE